MMLKTVSSLPFIKLKSLYYNQKFIELWIDSISDSAMILYRNNPGVVYRVKIKNIEVANENYNKLQKQIEE